MNEKLEKFSLCPPSFAEGYTFEKITLKTKNTPIEDITSDGLDPYQRLWFSVIKQCLFDIQSNNNKEEFKIIKKESFRWLFYDKNTFNLVASFLGYNPRVLRKQLIKFVRSDNFNKKTLT